MRPTASSSIIGFDKDLGMLAGETTTLAFGASFDPKYTNLCIETLKCMRCESPLDCGPVEEATYPEALKAVSQPN